MMRLIFLMINLYVLFPFSAHSQTKRNLAQVNMHPAFIALFVNNIDTMAHWYSEKLGFEILKQERPSQELGFAMLQGNGLMLEMIQNPKVTTRETLRQTYPAAVGTEGFFKPGFHIHNLNELELLELNLRQKGVKIKYPLMTNENFGMRLFIIEDPEGNMIQFYHIKKKS